MSTAEILKNLRLEKGLTQKEVADKIGVKSYTVANWEQGRAEPCLEYLFSLAKIFNVSTDYLLGLEDDFGAKINSVAGTDALSKDEKKLIEDFRHLNVYARQTILIQVEALAEKETQKN